MGWDAPNNDALVVAAAACPAPEMEGWACGVRTVNITESNVGMGTSLSTLISSEDGKEYTGSVTLNGAQYWQFLFGTTVTLLGVVYTQNVLSDQGTFDLETLSGGLYTAQAATIPMGHGGTLLGGRYVNEYAIDADKRALCDGIRLRGLSGALSNAPWRHNLRFFVSIPPP